MSRGLTSDFLAQLSSSSLKPFYAFKAEFAEGDLRLWTGLGAVSYTHLTLPTTPYV